MLHRVAIRGIVPAAFMLLLALFLHVGSLIAYAATADDPHAELLSSPLGCRQCHLYPSGIVLDYACVSCHILARSQGPQVYCGNEAHYYGADGFGHNGYGDVKCVSCHSIHGPTVDCAALSGRLLRPLSYQPAALAEVDLGTAAHDVALSVWCTGCHEEWPEVTPEGALLGHPFGPDDPGFAWNGCDSCLSCHAAPGGFPHYTPGADAGLIGALSANGERTGVADRGDDGVCLGCHAHDGPYGPEGFGFAF